MNIAVEVVAEPCSCTMMLELATMIAASEQAAVNVTHMQDAWAQLSTRPLSI